MRTSRWIPLTLVLLLPFACARPADETAEMEEVGETEEMGTTGAMGDTAAMGAAGASRGTSVAAMPAADVRAAVDRLREDWIAAANDDRVATVASMYAPEAVFVDFFGQEHRSREAIRASLEEVLAMGSNLEVTETWSTVVGDVHVSTGTWSQTVSGPEGETRMEGFYQVTARVLEGGAAQIVAHTSGIAQEEPEGME